MGFLNTTAGHKDNNKVYYVDFNCIPENVERSGKIHKGRGGRSDRHGIWEGVYLYKVDYKGSDGVWKVWWPNSSEELNGLNVHLETGTNGQTLECWATYRIWTMGLPHRSYPFLYFGNIGGNRNKYNRGYFSDASVIPPSSLKSSYAYIPDDWNHIYSGWVFPGKNNPADNWTYKDAMLPGGATWNGNSYEYRNGTNANGSNGWTSEAGNRPQETRKSSAYVFEKVYKASVVSNGIYIPPKHPNKPSVSVSHIKGVGGNVSVTATHPAGHNMAVWLRAYTNHGEQAEISTYNDSIFPNLNNGETKTIYVDFSKYFPQGREIRYYAWTRDYTGTESENGNGSSFNQSVGGHYFNTTPQPPTNVYVSGSNGVIYNNITVNWNKGYDADNDNLSYKLWYRFSTKEGQTIKEDYINVGNSLSKDFEITHLPDNSKLDFQIQSLDGYTTVKEPSWSNKCIVYKGEKASSAGYSCPINNSTVYSNSPRIMIETGNIKDTLYVYYNNTWYNNKDNSSLFSNSPNQSKYIVFKGPVVSDAKLTYKYKMKNEYDFSSEKTVTVNVDNFKYKDNYKPLKIDNINELRLSIDKIRTAYGLTEYKYKKLIDNNSVLDNDNYNEMLIALKEVNDKINNFDNNANNDLLLNIINIKDYDVFDIKSWNKLIETLTLI